MKYFRLQNSFQSLIGGKDKFEKTTRRMSDLILDRYKDNFQETKLQYLIGFTQSSISSTIWYNHEAFHVLPLALNTFNRALLYQHAGNGVDVFVTSKPFVGSKINADKLEDNIISNTQKVYNLFATLSLFWPMVFIGFYIKERESRAKLLQMISGANKIINWITSYLFDVVIYFIVYSILFAIAYIYIGDGVDLIEFFFIFTLYNVTVLPFVYLVSYAFTKPATGETLTVFGGYLGEFKLNYILIN